MTPIVYDRCMADVLIRFIADGLVFIVVIIATLSLLFLIPNKDKFRSYSRILLAGLTAYLLAKLVAAVYQPTDLRPFEILGINPGASYLDNPGFPSDHMLFVTAIVCAVWFETRKKKLSLVLAIMALLVGLGRVLALVHTPLDVIGGVVIALVGALWYSNQPKRGQRRIVLWPKSSKVSKK